MTTLDICEYLYDILPATLKPKYIGEVASATEEGVAIALNDGDDTIRFFGATDTIEQPYIRVYIRTKSYLKGSKFSSSVKETLNGYFNEDIGIMGLWLQGDIDYIGITDNKLHEFELLFKSMIRKE